jgi:hypothetical protein
VIGALRERDRERRLTTPFDAIVGSHLHLNVFRLLRSMHRQHELVLYDFLQRTYESRLARARGRGTPKGAQPTAIAADAATLS